MVSSSRLFLPIILIAILLAACSRYPDYSDQPPAVEPIDIIREVPGYDFFWPMSIDSDSGLVFIADYRDCNIKLFNHQLALLDSIGKKGEGPGEFKAIIDISAHQGMLATLNIYPPRISIFDYQGNLLHDFPVEATRWGELVISDRKTIYFARYKRNSQYFVTELTPEGEVISELLEHPGEVNSMISHTTRVRMRYLNGSLFLVFEQTPHIVRYGNDPFDISHDLSPGYPWIKRNERERERIYRTRGGVLTMTLFGGFAVLPEHLVLASASHNLLVLDLNSHNLSLLRMGSLGSDFSTQHQLSSIKRGSGFGLNRQGTDVSAANTFWDALAIDDEIWMLSAMNSCLVKFKIDDILSAAERGVKMVPQDFFAEK